VRCAVCHSDNRDLRAETARFEGQLDARPWAELATAAAPEPVGSPAA
jgi:hypothetical protein